MWVIFKKEFFGFFSSILGVLVVLTFLIVTGLMLWVFDTPYNILNAGYADLTLFFELAPWVFMFLIPGICMKSFSEEYSLGTIELLFTKPIGIKSLIFGKFFGAFALSIIAILPSLVYILSIAKMTPEGQSVDYGAITASYFGLLFLIAAYTAIGIHASSLTKNQLVAFIIGVVLSLFFYYVFYGISTSGIFGTQIYVLEYLSLNFHYKSILRGVIDTRNITYLASITFLFLVLTYWRLRTYSL
jgi:ABC-2 type transport system permease protein